MNKTPLPPNTSLDDQTICKEKASAMLHAIFYFYFYFLCFYVYVFGKIQPNQVEDCLHHHLGPLRTRGRNSCSNR